MAIRGMRCSHEARPPSFALCRKMPSLNASGGAPPAIEENVARDTNCFRHALVRAMNHATLAGSIMLLSLARVTMAQSPTPDSGSVAAHPILPGGTFARHRMGDGEPRDTVTSQGQVLVFNPSGRWSRSTHVGIGAVTGLLLGTAVFAAAFVHNSPSHCASQNGLPCALGLQIIEVPLIGGGAVLGGLIGALLPAARWEPIMPPKAETTP